jgi:hypothetical protein
LLVNRDASGFYTTTLIPGPPERAISSWVTVVKAGRVMELRGIIREIGAAHF